jgi:hypothetical protein
MSDPSSSKLDSLFQAALQRYEEQTGEKLIDHPLAQELEQCISVESITAVLQKQAQAFSEFRRVESKVMKPLKGIVHILHTLSTNTVLRKAISLVRRIVPESIYFIRRCFYSHFPLRQPYP